MAASIPSNMNRIAASISGNINASGIAPDINKSPGDESTELQFHYSLSSGHCNARTISSLLRESLAYFLLHRGQLPTDYTILKHEQHQLLLSNSNVINNNNNNNNNNNDDNNNNNNNNDNDGKYSYDDSNLPYKLMLNSISNLDTMLSLMERAISEYSINKVCFIFGSNIFLPKEVYQITLPQYYSKYTPNGTQDKENYSLVTNNNNNNNNNNNSSSSNSSNSNSSSSNSSSTKYSLDSLKRNFYLRLLQHDWSSLYGGDPLHLTALHMLIQASIRSGLEEYLSPRHLYRVPKLGTHVNLFLDSEANLDDDSYILNEDDIIWYQIPFSFKGIGAI